MPADPLPPPSRFDPVNIPNWKWGMSDARGREEVSWERSPVRGCLTVQSSAPGLVNFVIALAFHFCMALPVAFTQPGAHLLAKPYL